MAEPMTSVRIERDLTAVSGTIVYPRTPSLAPAVVARLRAESAAGRRRPFATVATWSRRRTLALATVGVLALLAAAFGARFVLGAAQVRVQPGVTPSGPPLGPGDPLGEPVTLRDAREAADFQIRLPSGPEPDAVYLVELEPAERVGVLAAWAPDGRTPALPGTPWALALLQLPDDAETVVKSVDRFEDLEEIDVRGRRAFWIDAPHQLVVVTAAGDRAFTVAGNVLIWSEGGVTFRLETALGRPGAIALAESIG
ncbi:MAG: hypothetical protein ACXWXQ_02465 [Actinomycetota bacterium]